jgi:hypothetical protein
MKPSTFTPTTSKCKSIPSRQQSRRSSKRYSRQLYTKTPQSSSYKSRLTNLFLALLPRIPLFFKWGNSLCTLNKTHHPARQGSTKTSRHSHLHSSPAPKTPPPATSAKMDAEDGFTTVSHKKRKTKKPTTLLPTPLPTADRKIVFKLSARATNSPHTVATRALQVVNKDIDAHPDISHPPCVSAHLTQSNAVVVVVAESYLAQETLKADGFPLAGSFVSERWTRFVLNGVSTKATPEEVQREMRSLYPSIRLGLPPRWADGTPPPTREKASRPHRWSSPSPVPTP